MQHIIRITPKDEQQQRFWRIQLDDMDVSAFVQGVHISLMAGEMPMVLLELAGHLDMPEGLKTVLMAQESEP